MASFYWAASINGGGLGSLDSIDPTNTNGSSKTLAVGDVCFVVDKENGVRATYEAKSTASMSESYPTVIIPDTNPSNWWWDLVTLEYDYESPVNLVTAYSYFPGVF